MKREDIEKAANKISFIETPDARERFLLRSGFKAGANWRINSVWHDWEDGNNVPDVGELCLVEFETDVDSKYYQRVVHADKFKGYNFTGRPYFWNTPKDAHIIRWAYVKDLLPSKEK